MEFYFFFIVKSKKKKKRKAIDIYNQGCDYELLNKNEYKMLLLLYVPMLQLSPG